MVMRRLAWQFAAAGLMVSAPTLAGSPPLTMAQAANSITAVATYATVERLAAPEFAGRLTGSPGYTAAARWVAAELKRAGLRALTGMPDLLQRFPVTVNGVQTASMELLAADDKGQAQRLENFKDFLPFFFSGTGEVTAEVVFIGFGITAPALGRDDYAGLDVKGKVVMAVRGAPKDGRDWTAHNSHRARTANARAHGAAGYLFAESAVANPNGDQIADLAMAEVAAEIANSILSESKLTLEDLRKVLEKGGVASFATGRKVHLAVRAKAPRTSEAANVIAALSGRDATLGEFVIVGGHLDHCGDWPVLLPGADDNASGSATVLEIARAAARLKPRPRRTVVFVFFAGEEEGLLGSKFFVAHLPAGLGRCVGMFNLDMEGAGNGAFVAGGKNFPELLRRLEEARDRRAPGMALRAGLSEGEARSDHGPFQSAGIAAVSLFGTGGSHHGYHAPDDTLWWITPKTMEAVGRVVLDAAVSVADAP